MDTAWTHLAFLLGPYQVVCSPVPQPIQLGARTALAALHLVAKPKAPDLRWQLPDVNQRTQNILQKGEKRSSLATSMLFDSRCLDIAISSSPEPLQNTHAIFDHTLVSPMPFLITPWYQIVSIRDVCIGYLPKSTACCLYSSLCLSCKVKQETSLQD